MKVTWSTLILVAAIEFTASKLFALDSDFEIHCVPKKVNEEIKNTIERSKMGTNVYGQPELRTGAGQNSKKENWAYDVTIENKTFKPVTDLQVKYAIYFEQEKQGTKEDPTAGRRERTYNIPTLGAHEKTAFTTESVVLKQTSLAGNFVYANGAKPNAHGTLEGLVLRIFQNGQQVAEYANPSTLLKEHR